VVKDICWRDTIIDISKRSFLSLAKDKAAFSLTILTLIMLLVTWESICRLLSIPVHLLPPPSLICQALYKGWTEPVLAREGYYIHTFYTLFEALFGFSIGSCFGIILGTMLSQMPTVNKLLYPYLIAFQATPKVALAPLFVIWFGFGLHSKVLLSLTLCFFPVLLNSIEGFNSVGEKEKELMASISATSWQTFRLVKVPTALPFIFAGLEVAIIYSIFGAIVGEFVSAKSGLGFLITQRSMTLDTSGMFAILIILAALASGLYLILTYIRRRMLFWSELERSSEAV
jgi:NitT/TauT family transport system permease protein